MSVHRLRRWCAAIVATAVTAGLLGGGSARAVAGAEPVPDGTYGFSAKVNVGDVNAADSRACSGALVDRSWVLTAKSCFAQGTAPVIAGAPSQPTTVVVGRTDLSGGAGHLLAATSITPHPDRDLVLVRLSTAINDVTPVGLATTAPAAGETLTVTGYGRTSTQWVPDRLHQASFAIQDVAATSINLVGASTGATICKGDAGGPVLRDNAGVPELVAINSTSWQKGCLGEIETRDGATANRVDDLSAWIGEQTADVQIFGVLADGRLTYAAIESASGDLRATRESTTSLGFAPRAMATLNENTVLVTSTAGTMHRVDITGLAPLTFTVTPLFGGWSTIDRMTYDGYGSLYGIVSSTNLLRRYTLTAHKPDAAAFTRYTDIGTGFGLKAITSPGPGRILGNVTDGRLRSYKINGNGTEAWSAGTLATTGWADPTQLLSPGGGIYYARGATGRLDRYRDLNPYDGSGSDIQSFAADPVSTTGWNQVMLSVRPWTGLVSVFGTRTDGRLSYTAFDPVTGVKRISTVSAQTLGFTPKAMATLNSDTVLVTTTGGDLYRVDITSFQPLRYTRTEQRLSGGWTHDRLVYDGHGSLFGQAGSSMLRYTVTKPKPADSSTDLTNRTVIGASGWTLQTLTTTGKGHLLTTVSDGRLRAYTVDTASSWTAANLALTGWNGFTSLVSPGGGLYYRRDTNGVLTGYLDTSPFDGSGTDLAAYLPTGTTSDGWDPILSALPYDSWPDNTRR
ncbi:trypsin-like serine protease [Phytohabitans suffuscus]|uniref:trypsin-like serine protease n=1 Tax=Phytohabitans suffuscus TaxID=624315 RepID=UPI001563CA2F|nr:tachylectin-related carbohydrate-binding protein [Phytohabitans suffuscus]